MLRFRLGVMQSRIKHVKDWREKRINAKSKRGTQKFNKGGSRGGFIVRYSLFIVLLPIHGLEVCPNGIQFIATCSP